jgi:TorA maturation chaperone TorD
MPVSPEMFRALGALCEPPDPAHARLAAALRLPAPPNAAAFTEVFVFHLVPYAAPYLSPDGMLGGDTADRVAGFWRALGITPPAEPDHLATLLGLYAALSEQEQATREAARRCALRDARRALLWEHLLTWVPPYTQAISALSSRFHGAWARLLRKALLDEARWLDAPPTPPLHLREVADLPGIGSGAFVRAVLAPARSGLVLTRHDLAGAAAAMGMGTRIGGRALILRALISQDQAATYRWLARQAAGWAIRHRASDPPLAGIAPHWYGRAEATRRLLHQTLLEAA